jgi:ankyrin repeat protein
VECKGPGSTIINADSMIYTLIFNRFLFVDLNICYLCKQPSARDILTELDRLQTAQTTDKSTDELMDPTYDRIFDAIRNQPKACASRAIRTLACLVTAQRILSIEELQIAVSLKADMTKLDALDLPDEEKLVDFCFGLVVKDDVMKTVRLAHFTAQEYLNRKDIIAQNWDTTLAIACTTYLSFDEFKKHYCPSCNSSVIQCDTHYFLKYAVANLSFHLNSSDQESTVEVFRRFLENEDNVLSYYNSLRRHSRLVRAPTQRIRLLDASALGHAVMVKHLLQNGWDTSTTDQDMLTPLHLASHNGHVKTVKRLLERGANPNTVDKWRNTPLHSAAVCGHTEVARFLLDRGADVTMVNDKLFTPLHSASLNGHLKTGKLLLQNGANPNDVNESKDTPIHLAARYGLTEVARLLLDGGADFTLANNDMSTPLHLASLNGHLKTVKFLLETGANPNAVDKWKNTPLHQAAQNGHTEVAQLLLDTGADTMLANYVLFTPLHYAAQSGHLSLVKRLVEIGGNSSGVGNLMETPHQVALQLGHTEVARLSC